MYEKNRSALHEEVNGIARDIQGTHQESFRGRHAGSSGAWTQPYTPLGRYRHLALQALLHQLITDRSRSTSDHVTGERLALAKGSRGVCKTMRDDLLQSHNMCPDHSRQQSIQSSPLIQPPWLTLSVGFFLYMSGSSDG